jgi:tRNA pseudouridine55 synthase
MATTLMTRTTTIVLRTMTAPDGILVIDKPEDWTSHDVVARCRKLAATRRVGHAGTLDPMATGVLVLGIGRATRLLGHLAMTTKGYDATIRLGQRTITDDARGDVVSETDATGVTTERLKAEVAALTGELMQVPSAVSAIKIKGERAYKRVRDGESVELAARPVVVSEFSISAVRRAGTSVDVDCHVECTSGTYVRALARDLGESLGVGGHLTALRRTRVGLHTLADSHQLEALAELASERLPVEPIDDVARRAFPTFGVSPDLLPAVRNGRALQVRLRAEGDIETAGGTDATPTAQPVAMLGPDGEFIALYAQHGPVAQAIAVFAPA